MSLIYLKLSIAHCAHGFHSALTLELETLYSLAPFYSFPIKLLEECLLPRAMSLYFGLPLRFWCRRCVLGAFRCFCLAVFNLDLSVSVFCLQPVPGHLESRPFPPGGLICLFCLLEVASQSRPASN